MGKLQTYSHYTSSHQPLPRMHLLLCSRRQPAFEWIYGWRPGDAHDPPKLPNRIASAEDDEAARAVGPARGGRKRGLKPAGGSAGALASGGSVEPPSAKRSKSAAELSAEAMTAAAAAGMAPMGMTPFGMPMAGAHSGAGLGAVGCGVALSWAHVCDHVIMAALGLVSVLHVALRCHCSSRARPARQQPCTACPSPTPPV